MLNVPLKKIKLIWRHPHCAVVQQKLCFCPAPMAFEPGGFFIVLQLSEGVKVKLFVVIHTVIFSLSDKLFESYHIWHSGFALRVDEQN